MLAALLLEALQWWRNLAGHARGLLSAAAQLSKGRVDDTTLARLNPSCFFPLGGSRAARRDPASFYGTVVAFFSGAAARHPCQPPLKCQPVEVASHRASLFGFLVGLRGEIDRVGRSR
jgi:hypothetical protein